MADDKREINPHIVPSSMQMVTQSSKSANFVDIYTNNSRVSVSPWDVSITFSLAKELMPGLLSSEDQCVIRMSPQQFKIFTNAIVTTLKAWEEVFGEITATSPLVSFEKTKAGIANLKEAVFKNVPTA